LEHKDKVLNHFEKISDNFDGIYHKQKGSTFHKLLDLSLRSAILKKRMALAVDLCGDIGNKKILDIGCGPGRYAIELAKKGPAFVLGIDMSPQMINLANSIVKDSGYAGVCKFEVADFTEKQFKDKFHTVLAIGVFDYIKDPRDFLAKIICLTEGRAVFSFPVKYTLLTPARKVWLMFKGCPSFYYTKGKIKRLLDAAGFEILSMRKIGSFIVNGNYMVACKRRSK